MTFSILIAEDDNNIRQGIIDTLESEDYNVTGVSNGKDAVKQFYQNTFDLVILDIMMPQKNGYDVLMEIRAKNKTVPVLMLSAKSEEIDKVMGLNLGADDYITKPFGIFELLARIKAALRRADISTSQEKPSECPDIFSFGNAVVDSKKFIIKSNGEEIEITNRELEIMKLFFRNQGQVIKRDELLNEVWGVEYYKTTRTLDQHIAMLRKKIENKPSDPKFIKTVHGIGYRYSKI